MDYDALSRRDKRAMNRIRKRHAALVLFGGLNEDGGVEAKKAKLSEADSSGGEEDGQMQGEQRDQQAPRTSSANVSTAASSSLPSCSSISPTHFSSTSAKMVASAADNLLEQAKALSREVRQKVVEQQSQPHPRQQGPKFRLQLEKLQGRNLGERELAAFLHKMALGSHNASSASKSAAKWIRFETRWKPLQFLVVRVNCEDRRMLDTHHDAPFIDDYFNKHWIRMAHNVRDRDKFWQAIGTVVQSRHELLIRKIKTSGDPLLALRRPERKAQLLMSLEQMVDSKYPFPTENAPVSEEGNHPKQQAKWKDIMANQGQIPQKSGSSSDGPRIRPTRQIYRCIGEQSPILALDCEMCYTTAERLELTRISVVNEKGETLMDQLVKPHNKITNYITHKSGITEQMLKNVTNRLKDVQRQFCALLTDDTILCGHSLENDLEALQLSHPFCIDTSILFNFAGRANIRSGLKALAKIFLDEDIQQDSRHGHCSLEDARTTLKLLQLKLDKGLQFGNVALGWNFSAWARANGMTITGTRICNATVMEMVKRGPIEGEGADEGQEKGGEGGELTGETKTTSQASEEQKQQQNLDGDDGPAANAKGKFFDFAEAVRIDNAMQKTAQFTDCYHWANEATKRRRSILVAMPEPNAFFKANECASLINLSNHAEWDLADANSMEKADQFPKGTNNKNNNKIHRICSRMAPKLIEHDLIFVELNCPRTMPKAELDKAFGALIEGACNNSMVILVMSAAGGGRSGANALMYVKIHHQQQEEQEKKMMMGEEEEEREEGEE